jgi:hypothetical protein
LWGSGYHVRVEASRFTPSIFLEAGGQPACAHWQRFVATYGRGSHGAALAPRLKDCEAL